MVDESLKRLLDAEAQAEQTIARAEAERDAILDQARQDVEALKQQHAVRLQEIQSAFIAQAGQRAQQTIAELKRRHDERVAALQVSARNHEDQALDAAIELLNGPPQQ